MEWKRTISSVFDKNFTTNRLPQITIRSIVQLRNHNKVLYYCSKCNRMLVYSQVKNWYKLLEKASLNILEVINKLTEALKDFEIQDNKSSKVLENIENINDKSSEVLENIENINDKSSQLTTLNEQKVDKDQQVNLLS